MAPVTHAATLQLSRTLNSSWRNSNHTLIQGGAMQLQANKSGKGEQAFFPSLGQPVSTLLSTRPPREFRQLPQEMLGAGRPRQSRSKSPEQMLVPTALRERVASTRYLSKTLRNECLERLDQIVVPRKLCQRPSWTHLEDTVLGSSAGPRESDVNSARQDLDFAFAATLPSEVVQISEDHGHDELVFGLSEEESLEAQRDAALNFLRDFHATPAPKLETAAPEAEAEKVTASQEIRTRTRKELHGRLQEEPRYLKLWSMDDADHNAATTSVWKSTAKGNPSNRMASSPSSGAGARLRGIAGSPGPTDSHKRNIHATRCAVEAARSETQASAADEESLLNAGLQASPSRGVSSMLRTSLRYILQT